jgi:hypothetical protein
VVFMLQLQVDWSLLTFSHRVSYVVTWLSAALVSYLVMLGLLGLRPRDFKST